MKNNVVFFAAHPDDIEGLICGAALNHARAGDVTIEAIMTRGEKGAILKRRRGAKLAALREREARACAPVMGFREILFFDFPDADLKNTPHLRETLKKVIDTHQPSIIYAPEFQKSAYPHKDHIELGKAVWDVCQSFVTRPVLRFFHPSEPTDVYSIDEHAATRRRLLAAHKSQYWINSLIKFAAFVIMPLKIIKWMRQAGSTNVEVYREVKPC